MFRQALLESSTAMHRRSPWPMATAFTLELIIASVLVLLPLISTGILPLTSRLAAPPRYTPIDSVRPIATTTVTNRSGVALSNPQVIQVANLNPLLISPFSKIGRSDISDAPTAPLMGVVNGDPNGPRIEEHPIPPKPPVRLIISNLSEGMLLTKVIPEYPAVARVTGMQGDVKLHAIIAKDGTIQSLVVTSGPEMLREAALRAVQQWKYRPYMLNGQAVEVETIITISFHRL